MSVADWSMEVAPARDVARKTFTPDQANESLVLVKRIVGDVVAEYQVLLELEEMIESAEASGHRGDLEDARQQLVQAVDVLQTCLEELDQIGVELRDFARGIVDFPADVNGRPISLCWLHGEPRVSHWHDVGASFACRQPLALLNSEEAAMSDLLI
ncbi:MAG: DUF2203 family protein [Planctomycetes bacterium]|nr:DUF2203 domain-containing protein [Phycisphaerae bacterium]NBB95699.1 DUF2203 family protein [Planctomycetota bacterium]